MSSSCGKAANERVHRLGDRFEIGAQGYTQETRLPDAFAMPPTSRRTENRSNGASSQSFADWIVKRAGLQRRNNGKSSRASETADGQFDNYVNRIKSLLEIANQQASELRSERKNRLRAERQLADTRDRLRESERSGRENRRTIRRANRELNSLKRDGESLAVVELRQQLDRLQSEYVDALDQEQSKRVEAEAKATSLKEKLETLQQSDAQTQREAPELSSIPERVQNERDRRRKAEKEARNLKRKLRHASRSLNTLRRDYSKSRNQTYATTSNGHVSGQALFDDLLPKLRLARDSASRLFDARDTKQVFDDLVRLHDNPGVMRGERVGSAEPWLEIRPTLTDRIYYRQDKGRRKYVVLVGDKNTQANDIEWMRRNN